MPIGADPLDRLRASNPVRAEVVPDASLARVTARVQEHIMSESRPNPDIKRARGPLAVFGGLAAVGALALAVAFGSGLSASTPGGTADPGGNPAAGGGGVASCLAYDPAELPNFEVVFDGTVTAVDGDQVTFTVNEGWKGADGTITLTAPDVSVALLGELPEFSVGGRYLVTAAGSTINACGYTVEYDADVATDWAAAF